MKSVADPPHPVLAIVLNTDGLSPGHVEVRHEDMFLLSVGCRTDTYLEKVLDKGSDVAQNSSF
jgi:hypothetical protein